MIRRVLYLGRWTVDFLFAEKEYDIEEVLTFLYDMDADGYIMDECIDLMMRQAENTGFTYSDPMTHRALVVIGPTSSSEEFLNTLIHEIHHLAVSVAKDLGVDLEKETPAYIAGDAAMSLASIVCKLGCSHCKG